MGRGWGVGGGGTVLCLLCLLMKKLLSAQQSADPWGSSRAEGQVGSRAEGWGSGAPSPRNGTLWGRNLQKLLRKSKVRRQSTGLFSVFFPHPPQASPRKERIGKWSWVCPRGRAGPGRPRPGGRTPLSCRTHQQELERKEDPASDQPP